MESLGQVELDRGYLIVLDHPDFLRALADAVYMVKSGKQIAEVLPAQIDLASVASLYQAKTVGGKVERSEPFACLASYYAQERSSDY